MIQAVARRRNEPRSARRAANQRRYRARVRQCRASYRVDIDGQILSMLIRRRYIDEREADDARIVGEALTHLLADLAAGDPLI
jgi:cytochrome P450